MSRKKQEKAILILLLVASFACILVLLLRSAWGDLFGGDIGGLYNLNLLTLGEERLGLVSPMDRNRPREFLRFEFMQDIRAAGFEPVWRGDRYIFRDLESGEETDPFQLHTDKKLRGVSETVLGQHEKNSILEPGSPDYYNTADSILSEIYYHHLMGFHLVARENKFLYVRSALPTDMEITFEQLFLRDIVVTYNAYALQQSLWFLDRNEALLNSRGLIMKKGEGGYAPVYLETGAVPELPPRKIFVSEAWQVISNCLSDSGGDYFARRRFPESPPPGAKLSGEFYTSCVAAKETLDLYGVKFNWNSAKERYQRQRQDKDVTSGEATVESAIQ